jgi:hypothetical protein
MGILAHRQCQPEGKELNEVDTALRWVHVCCLANVHYEIQIAGPVEAFANRVRASGYIQAPGCYIQHCFIIGINEIPAPSLPPGAQGVTITSPAQGAA